MEEKKIIELLNRLIQLDADALEAYHRAIKHLEYQDIRNRLTDFQDDHKGHIQGLSAMVMQLGGRPVKAVPDLKGYLMEGFTILMSVSGSLGALESMKAIEVLINRRYAEAAGCDLPEEVAKLVKSNLGQEQRHLRYLQEVIDTPRHELR